MAAFVTSGNAIVDYLNKNKQNHGDVGNFKQVGEPLNVSAEVEQNMLNEAIKAKNAAGATAAESSYNSVYADTEKKQKYTYDAMTQAIKQTLNIKNEPIKLIILERKGNAISLDCNAFLLDKDRMIFKSYFQGLNHVIIGKIDDAYTVIGYVENPSGGTQYREVKVCQSFKLQTQGKVNTCARLPEIIKGIIFKCIKQHYNENTEPSGMKLYYNPQDTTYSKEVAAEAAREAQLAAAEAAAEVKPNDQCDFKARLKSKIKNNESNEYCKVTDLGLLERIQQNIDENKVDVDINGVNDLIKTRLDNLKKVKEEEEKDEDEEKDREDGKKTISEKVEATMIRDANEMFVISQQVSKKLNKGTTYSSSEFFKEYLMATAATVTPNAVTPVTPIAAATVPANTVQGVTVPGATGAIIAPVAAPVAATAAAPITAITPITPITATVAAPETPVEAVPITVAPITAPVAETTGTVAAPITAAATAVETPVEAIAAEKEATGTTPAITASVEAIAAEQVATAAEQVATATTAAATTEAQAAPAATRATTATTAAATNAITAATTEAIKKVAEKTAVPGPKEVTPPPPTTQPNFEGAVQKLIKERRKSSVNPFTYTPI
jgi:hypothetical protein